MHAIGLGFSGIDIDVDAKMELCQLFLQLSRLGISAGGGQPPSLRSIRIIELAPKSRTNSQAAKNIGKALNQNDLIPLQG
jgi:hypothetical protein